MQMPAAASYVELVKFRYHVTFLNVVFAALIFTPQLTAAVFVRLGLLYLVFNVLLYGGIYTLNDVADRESDRRHPLKRLRPIASGAISLRAAVAFGMCLILAGCATAWFAFNPGVVACFGAVAIVNVVYSLGGRNIPYLDVLLNAWPHTIRFTMGALLVERAPRAEHLIAITLLAIGLSCLRRHVEQDTAAGSDARVTLRRYPRPRLEALGFSSVALLAIVSLSSARVAPGFTATVLTAGLVLICGGHRLRLIREPLRSVWTR
jgi:decaprenyl-phosphate phosphoribosyltransferase